MDEEERGRGAPVQIKSLQYHARVMFLLGTTEIEADTRYSLYLD